MGKNNKTDDRRSTALPEKKKKENKKWKTFPSPFILLMTQIMLQFPKCLGNSCIFPDCLIQTDLKNKICLNY